MVGICHQQHSTARLIEVNALGCLSPLQNIWYAIFRVSLTHTHFNFFFFFRRFVSMLLRDTFVWRHKIWWVPICLVLGQRSFVEMVTVIFSLSHKPRTRVYSKEHVVPKVIHKGHWMFTQNVSVKCFHSTNKVAKAEAAKPDQKKSPWKFRWNPAHFIIRTLMENSDKFTDVYELFLHASHTFYIWCLGQECSPRLNQNLRNHFCEAIKRYIYA